MPPKKTAPDKTVETLTHDEAKRLNIPTTELSAVARKEDLKPVRASYRRRDPDLDPQLIWRGKYGLESMEDGELAVRAAPLYIQEKVHPKALIDDLKRESGGGSRTASARQLSLFADFNGIPEGVDKTEFYQHEQNWANRLVLGDSLQVMAGLAEREGLRGKVQCIYFDPPYGIKFNSNFQWSTTSRDVKDNKTDHITREPEQVKAFRDTWRDGIHSYLSYIRDRLIVARDLLTDSGSIFVQIGDENVHRVRAVMDEVFGGENHISTIGFLKTSSATSNYIPSTFDSVIWFGKNIEILKYRQMLRPKSHSTQGASEYAYFLNDAGIICRLTQNDLLDMGKANNSLRIDNLTSQSGGDSTRFKYSYQGREFVPGSGGWKTNITGMKRLDRASRLYIRSTSMNYVRFLADFPALPMTDWWEDTAIAGWSEGKVYVVQTARRVVERCLLMATDPGDLVLDPTCGSGTTAYVAEQWGRRWITIDTSRVALALARARLMGARYPYYLLADSPDGQKKEAEIIQAEPTPRPAYGKISHGFVYERVPHITLKSIANNTEIDVIWEKWQEKLEPLRQKLNAALKTTWEEWEIPREEAASWSNAVKKLHASWWQARMDRQKEIDASIAARADTEYLYDKPYVDNKKVRVAGPFTVESISPHRMLTVDENDEIIDPLEQAAREGGKDFASMILEELKIAGVEQASKEDKITFTSLRPWPGRFVNGEGVYEEGGKERRAAI
ncbi:MAG: site-specific DNA-methyltransferase, partial [Planctomycetes bacterium]|nr:site-specific DNA-methyltransferase [Planctomycetota bacterium]